MTRDDIIRMAIKAAPHLGEPHPDMIDTLAMFAGLVAAAEREECAKVRTESKRNKAMWACPHCGSVGRAIDRYRHSDGHLAKHCGCRISKTKHLPPDQVIAQRKQAVIERKRKYRREAGAQLRVDIAAQAQAKSEERERLAEFRRLLKGPLLHDAHVKRWRQCMWNRAKYAERYKSDPRAENDRQKRRKQALPDSYVIQNIKAAGIPIDAITPDLIAIKREAMQYGRMSRTIKTTVKNHLKENNEAITKHT